MTKKKSYDFNTNKYMTARLQARVADIAVPQLALWYPENCNPTLQVSGLTGADIAKVREAVELNESLSPLAKSYESGEPDAVAAMKGLHSYFGSAAKNPSEYVRQLNIVKGGCVGPKLKHEQVVRLAQDFPVLFGQISRKILELTGLGRVAEKS